MMTIPLETSLVYKHPVPLPRNYPPGLISCTPDSLHLILTLSEGSRMCLKGLLQDGHLSLLGCQRLQLQHRHAQQGMLWQYT